ncbi:MAG: GNAT family N-acetyltransferase [Colwellia sp.]
MHRFTTERLLIKPLTKQDEALYVSLYTDNKVMRSIGCTLSEKKAKAAFNRTLTIMKKPKPSIITWVIISLSDNKPIGIQALHWRNTKNEHFHTPEINAADIGIMLLTTANGQLFPEEAMGALIEYAFHYLLVKQINAFYAKKNLATKRFIKKLGFVFNPELQSKESTDYFEYCRKEQWQQQIITQVLINE